MFTIRKLILAGVMLTALPWSAAQAHGFIGIGIGIPIGGYYGPYPYYGGYYYYPPYPTYVAPPPTVVVQQPPPVATAPAQLAYPAPAPLPAAAAASETITIRPTLVENRRDEIDNCMAHLGNPDERVRADMAIQLGRMRALRAVDTLNNTLASDRSATVRDAAARALGLIGSNASLAALDRAAQSDDDRDVRRSSQYAAEVIRANRGR